MCLSIPQAPLETLRGRIVGITDCLLVLVCHIDLHFQCVRRTFFFSSRDLDGPQCCHQHRSDFCSSTYLALIALHVISIRSFTKTSMLRPSAPLVEEQLVDCTLTFLQAFHGLARLVIESECKLTAVIPLLSALWHESTCYSYLHIDYTALSPTL